MADSQPISIAILGDSDSHSFRDEYDNKARGGDFHHVTYNWPALWDKFRSNEVNLGKFDAWGIHYRIARVLYWLDIETRSPKKLDFEYNYAVSGLRCKSLLRDWPFQAQWMEDRLKRYPEQWQNGVVVIRIGVNDLGQNKTMDQWAQNGFNETAQTTVNACVEDIITAAETLMAAHPQVRIALVGVCRNYNIGKTQELWPDNLNHLKNINSVLTEFDNGLAKFANQHDRVAFVDDVNWFTNKFGDRVTNSLKNQTHLTNGFMVNNSNGNHPSHLILKDGHAGTIYNGWWLNDLIHSLNQAFQLKLTPLTDDEIYSVIEPAIKSN